MSEETNDIVHEEVIGEIGNETEEATKEVVPEAEPKEPEEKSSDEKTAEEKEEKEAIEIKDKEGNIVPDGFIKANFDGVDLSNEHVQKAVMKAYNAEKNMNQVLNEVDGLKKEAEKTQELKKEQEIKDLDFGLRNDFHRLKADFQQSKNQWYQALESCCGTEQSIQFLDGNYYQVNDSNISNFKENVAEYFAHQTKNLEDSFVQANKEIQEKKSSIEKEKSNREYKEFNQKITDKLKNTPEIKDVVDFMQNTFLYDEEPCNKAIEVIEGVIQKVITRTLSEHQLQKNTQKQKQKMTSIAGKGSQADSFNLKAVSDSELSDLALNDPAKFKELYC